MDKVTGLINELLRNPSESFVRFLLAEVELVSGRVTKNVVERFIPIVKKAIQTTLLDMMTKSIQQEIAQPNNQPISNPSSSAPLLSPAEALKKTAEAGEEGTAQIETTELGSRRFSGHMQKLCEESALKQAISYEDSVNYFGINLGKVRAWFLRVFTNGKKRFLVTRLPVEQAAMLAPGLEVDAAPEVWSSASTLNAPADLDKLRALVLVAYEDEAKRLTALPPEGGTSGNDRQLPLTARSDLIHKPLHILLLLLSTLTGACKDNRLETATAAGSARSLEAGIMPQQGLSTDSQPGISR